MHFPKNCDFWTGLATAEKRPRLQKRTDLSPKVKNPASRKFGTRLVSSQRGRSFQTGPTSAVE